MQLPLLGMQTLRLHTPDLLNTRWRQYHLPVAKHRRSTLTGQQEHIIGIVQRQIQVVQHDDNT